MVIPNLAQFASYRVMNTYDELWKALKEYDMNRSAYLAASLSNSALVGSISTQPKLQHPIEEKMDVLAAQ